MGDLVETQLADIALTRIEDESRIEDLELARWLEYEKPADIRELIKRHGEFLRRQGVLPHRTENPSALGGRPGRAFWLNKKQALFVAAKSEKPRGSELLLLLVDVFDRAEREAMEAAIERAASESYLFRKLFLETPLHTEKLWTPARLGPIAALYGEKYEGGRPPVATKTIQREIYDHILGSSMVRQLREKYPEPPGEYGQAYIYDHLHPEVRKGVDAELDKIAALATTSTSRDDFRAKLRALYGTSMLQLVFGGKQTSKWSLPPRGQS